MIRKYAVCFSCFCLAASAMSCSGDDRGCTAGDRSCSGNIIRVCEDGSWVDNTICAGDMPVCDPVVLSCVSESGCNPGSRQCIPGNKLAVCDSDRKWIEGLHCEGELPVCGLDETGTPACVKTSSECEPGETKCGPDNSLKMCTSEGRWGSSVTCGGVTPVCALKTDGSYGCIKADPVCTPFDTKCVSDTVLMSCGENGMWLDSETCPSGRICRETPEYGAECVEDTSECTDGDTKCSGNSLITCSDGMWGEEKQCEGKTPYCGVIGEKFACSDSIGPCFMDGSIVPEDGRVCLDGDLQVCRKGIFYLEKDCQGAEVCNAQNKSCAKPSNTLESIKDIRKSYSKIVKDSPSSGNSRIGTEIMGTVTYVLDNRQGFYLQDETAGVFVSCPDRLCTQKLAIGDKVRVKSDNIGYEYSQLQIRGIKSLVVEKITSGIKFQPIILKYTDDIKSGNYDDMYVRLSDRTMKKCGSSQQDNNYIACDESYYRLDVMYDFNYYKKGYANSIDVDYQYVYGMLLRIGKQYAIAPRDMGDLLTHRNECENEGDIRCGMGDKYEICRTDQNTLKLWHVVEPDIGTICKDNAVVCEHEGGSCTPDNTYIQCSGGKVFSENCLINQDGRTDCDPAAGCVIPKENRCSLPGITKCEGQQGYRCSSIEPYHWVKFGDPCSNGKACLAYGNRVSCK